MPPKKSKPIVKATTNIPGDLLYFPMCFDKEYLVYNDAGEVMGVESYRNYYNSKQDVKMVWKGNKPDWINDLHF